MDSPLNILFVNNSEDQNNSVVEDLRKKGMEFEYQRVETEEGLREALPKKKWDLVLCNDPLAQFDGLSALQELSEEHSDILFLLLPDKSSEETSVKVLRAGETDDTLKHNMQRLTRSIEKELEKAEIHSLHKKSEEERNLLLKVVEQSSSEIYIASTDTLLFEYVNQTALENLGYSENEIKDLKPSDINPDTGKSYFQNALKSLLTDQKEKVVFYSNHKRKDGSIYPIELHLQLIKQGHKKFFAATAIDQTNRQKDAQIIDEQKKIAEELSLVNEYKSQFMANMSHELRTPLNSINLLSRLLLHNRPGNLNPEQIEYLEAIHQSGNNLLDLINEVLDFSQVEAGEIKIQLESVAIGKICSSLEMLFSPVLREKGLVFSVKNEDCSNLSILTDSMRLEQILKNLLSNACKFTEKGSVELSAYRPDHDETSKFNTDVDKWVAFRVQDTGIGIPKDKHQLIFEAFQQTDHSTQRKYGGTGLGLSICRELTNLLGGNLILESDIGTGSTFTLYIPADARTVLEEKDYLFKDESASDSSIVAESIHPSKHSQQPKKNKQLLLVDDSEIHVSALKELLETDHIKCLVAGTAQATYNILDSIEINCLVLDLGLPDASGFEVIRKIRSNDSLKHIPIIVYTGKSLSEDQIQELEEMVTEIIIKTSNNFGKLQGVIYRSLEIEEIRDPKNTIPESDVLKSKNVLLVDDDDRNIYSLSLVLEELGMEVKSASNGREALNLLHENPEIDVVLMDIMMPVMDGYEAIKQIRKTPQWASLPVIAVTTHTMQGDRKKCLDAGANDYISKPIRINNLIDTFSNFLKQD